MAMDIYTPKIVEQLRAFYGELLERQTSYQSVAGHLEALAGRMWEGVREGNEIVFQEIANYHSDHLGRSYAVLGRLNLDLSDCRHAIANEYGFGHWTEASHQVMPYDMDFERTVEDLLKGDLEGVKESVGRDPSVLLKHSRYGHGATLLHYSVSNGVEIWRQRVPFNLPAVVAFLLESGANPEAKMKVYGGEYTPSELLLSSLHPRNAGIFDELRHLMDT
jgi:hypothetical protein